MFDSDAAPIENGSGVDNVCVGSEFWGERSEVQSFRGNFVPGVDEKITSVDGNEFDIGLGREIKNQVRDAVSLNADRSMLVNHGNVDEGTGLAESNVGGTVDTMDCSDVEKTETSAGQESEEDVTDNCNLKSVYSIGDLVWAKSKGKSCSPGQIWDPLRVPKTAPKRPESDCFLVRYLDTYNYVWCGQSQLKHFHENFKEMSTHSNSKSFTVALKKALSVFRRRVKSEMTCPCNPHADGYISAGQVSDDAEGEKNLLPPNNESNGYSVAQFEPLAFISDLKNLAKVGSVTSKLECTVIQSRLWAYYCSLGHRQMPLSQLRDVDGLIGDDNPVLDEASLSGNDVKEKQDGDTLPVDGTDKNADMGSESRDRKKSKYLSPPFTVPKGNQDSGADVKDSFQGTTPIKCSCKKYQKRKLTKPVDPSKYSEAINKSSVELLSELHMAALDCLYPNKSQHFDSVKTLFTMFRKSVYHDESENSGSYTLVNSEDKSSSAPDNKSERKKRLKKEVKNLVGVPMPIPGTTASIPETEILQAASHTVKPPRKKRVEKGAAPTPPSASEKTGPAADLESSQVTSPVVKRQRKKRAKKETAPIPALVTGTPTIRVLPSGTAQIPDLGTGIAPAPLLAAGTTTTTPGSEGLSAANSVVKPKRKRRTKKECSGPPILTTGTALGSLLTAEISLEPFPDTGRALEPFPIIESNSQILDFENLLVMHHPVSKLKPVKRKKEEATDHSNDSTTANIGLAHLNGDNVKPGSLVMDLHVGRQQVSSDIQQIATSANPNTNLGNIPMINGNVISFDTKMKETGIGTTVNGNPTLNDNVNPSSLVMDFHMGQQQVSSDTQQLATSVNLNTNLGANIPMVNGNVISFDTKLRGNGTETTMNGATTLGTGLLGANGINISHDPKLPEPKKRKRKKKEQATINFQNNSTGVPGFNLNGMGPILLGKDSHGLKPARKRRKKSEDAIMKNNKANTTREAFRTTLQLSFATGSPISKQILVTVFSRFESFKESETSTFDDSNSAHVVFTENSDAVEAVKYIETDKPFGEALVSYKFQHLSAPHIGSESVKNLRVVPISPSEVAKKNSNPVSEAPSLLLVRQNLQFMTNMLQRAGNNLSADSKAKLEADIESLMQKVCTITGSSSS